MKKIVTGLIFGTSLLMAEPSFLTCKMESGSSANNIPVFLMKTTYGLAQINRDEVGVSNDGNFDSISNLDIEMQFRVGKGLSLGNSSMIRVKYNKGSGNSSYSGVSKPGVSSSGDVENDISMYSVEYMDIDFQKNSRVWWNAGFNYHKWKRDFVDAGAVENIEIPYVNIGFGTIALVGEVTWIGFDINGYFAPKNSADVTTSTQSENFNLGLGYGAEAKIPLLWQVNNNFEINLDFGYRFFELGESNSKAGLSIPETTLQEMDVDVGFTILF